MPPKAAQGGKGKGGGGPSTGGKGGPKGGKPSKGAPAATGGSGHTDAASRIAEMDGGSIEAESNIEILRAQRAAARSGTSAVKDSVRETEGIDEADPLKAIDDGIRIEPFNMRREMAEGHFDEGGFYVLNKDEEKEVTDAWLDTVDHAQKSAAFKKEEEKKKAGLKAANRLQAISKNLKEGGDDDDEDKEEDDEDKKEGEEGDEQKDKGDKVQEEAPEEEAEEDTVEMLEKLIAELQPLETPTMALTRLNKAAKTGKATQAASQEPLKLRSRMRAAKPAVSAKAAVTGTAPAQKPKRKRFNEWGYEEAASEPQTKKQSTGEGSVNDSAAIAAAAEKAAAKEKAEAEAAAAFASEMKVTRHVLREFAGVEAQAILNLNADDVRKTRPDEQKEDGQQNEEEDTKDDETPLAKRPKTEQKTNDVQKESRQIIGKLTDLCDALLQKGINVYDSARELLTIEVRERKGETIGQDAPVADKAAPVVAPSQKPAAEKKESKPVLYDNKRVGAAGESSVVDADKFEASKTVDQPLLWQLKWAATPDELHGPFDSLTMHGWMSQGCFSEERVAEFRQCDSSNKPLESCWHSWDKMDFELYL